MTPSGHSSRRHPRTVGALLMAATLWVLALSASPAAASTFTVTSVNDTGPNSLREAIVRANDEGINPGQDTINITATGTINLATALPAITAPVVINGPGINALVLRRPLGASDFRLLQTGMGISAEIRNLSMRGGRVSTADAVGGAIEARGPL